MSFDIAQVTGPVTKNFDAMKHRTTDKFADLTSAAAANVDLVKDGFSDFAQRASDETADAVEKVRRESRRYVKRTERLMRKDPLKTFAAALGLGVVIGGMLAITANLVTREAVRA